MVDDVPTKRIVLYVRVSTRNNGFWFRVGQHPSIVVESAAQRLFVAMLFTQWCRKLARCRNKSCGRYYLLNKARPVYKRGTMCGSCNRIGSATRRVLQQRAEQYAQRLRLATDAMRWWKRMTDRQRTAKGQNVREYIRRFVNEKTVHARITTKWVTRNFAKIERQANS